MTYYACEIGEAGNECFRQETLLPLILLSSSPVLLSLVFITACSVLCPYLGPFSCLLWPRRVTQRNRDTNKMLQSLEKAEMNSVLKAEFREELTFEET